jgi:hypothetical protein
MADLQELLNGEETLFAFMVEHGYPVYHKSNMFLRDVQYAVRDYYRERHGIDIGTRKADAIAAEFIAGLERRGVLKPYARQAWILNDERYLKQPAVQEESDVAAETAESN